MILGAAGAGVGELISIFATLNGFILDFYMLPLEGFALNKYSLAVSSISSTDIIYLTGVILGCGYFVALPLLTTKPSVPIPRGLTFLGDGNDPKSFSLY